MKPAIGIDLGTTNSAIAHATSNDIEVLANANGNRITPSVVAYDEDKQQALVGRQAVNQSTQNPGQTVFSVKRYMGSDEVLVLGNDNEFTPEEISALILKKVVKDAEDSLGTPITNVVITVPAYFNDRQRQATKHAGEIAGLNVDRIINEPTAACLAYGLRAGDGETVVVYDLGGGTIDTSLIEIDNGVFEVVATNGDTELGGDDWDAAIVGWLEDKIEREHGFRPDDDLITTERLFDAAQDAKHRLSSRQKTEINVPFLEYGGDTYNINQTLSRETFEQLTNELTEETISIVDDLLADAQYDPSAVDEVLLVGGSTRMPHIQEHISTFFGQEPSKRVNPDEAVAIGGAAQSAIMRDDPVPVPNEDAGAMPTTNGAASGEDALAGVSGDDIILVDVTPQSLGVKSMDLETREYYYHVLLPRNTSVPARETNIFSTIEDDQTFVNFPVYQGESSELEENEKLDEFEIGPIPKRPLGEPDIEVEFSLDQNGILNVSAEDIDHEIGDEIEIQSVFGFSDKQLNTMQQNLPRLR